MGWGLGGWLGDPWGGKHSMGSQSAGQDGGLSTAKGSESQPGEAQQVLGSKVRGSGRDLTGGTGPGPWPLGVMATWRMSEITRERMGQGPGQSHELQ